MSVLLELKIGVLKYEDIEGGVWKLETYSGELYVLMGLPKAFQEDNLKVAAILKKQDAEASIFMMGTVYEVLEIQKI